MKLDLVAPRYEPAIQFNPPTAAPFEFGVDTLTIEDLMSAKATQAILKKNAAWAWGMAQAPQFLPFRSTFTVRDAATFMPSDMSKSIAATDAALRAMPQSERPDVG